MQLDFFSIFRPKKSIFKSKSQAGSSSGSQKRGLALYKNKFSAHQEEKEEEEQLGDFKARVLHQAITVGAKSRYGTILDLPDFTIFST